MNVHDNFGKERKDFNAKREEYFQNQEANPLLKGEGHHSFNMSDETRDRMHYVDTYGNAKTLYIDKLLFELLCLSLEAEVEVNNEFFAIIIKDKESIQGGVEKIRDSKGPFYVPFYKVSFELEVHNKKFNLYHKLKHDGSH